MSYGDAQCGGATRQRNDQSSTSVVPKPVSKPKKHNKPGRPKVKPDDEKSIKDPNKAILDIAEIQNKKHRTFADYAQMYLILLGGNIATTTMERKVRTFNMIDRDLKYLREQKKISTTNPKKLTAEDVIVWMGLQRSGEGDTHSGEIVDRTVSKYFQTLKELLDYLGNPAATQAKTKYKSIMPREVAPMLPPIEDPDRMLILQTANSIHIPDPGSITDSEWYRILSYALVVFAICSGLRVKEIKAANIEDLDYDLSTILVTEVKGKRKWGQTRLAFIHPDARPFLRLYLEARTQKLNEYKIRTNVLFPPLQDKDGDGRYSSNGLKVCKDRVKDELGLEELNFQYGRRTYCQFMIDEHPEMLSEISRSMGHANTGTTEGSYGRVRTRNAVNRLERAMRPTPGIQETNNYVSDAPNYDLTLSTEKSDSTGYTIWRPGRDLNPSRSLERAS